MQYITSNNIYYALYSSELKLQVEQECCEKLTDISKQNFCHWLRNVLYFHCKLATSLFCYNFYGAIWYENKCKIKHLKKKTYPFWSLPSATNIMKYTELQQQIECIISTRFHLPNCYYWHESWHVDVQHHVSLRDASSHIALLCIFQCIFIHK